MSTHQQMIDALKSLRVNRPLHLANRMIRRILLQYGGGAAHVDHVPSHLYDAVIAACGGNVPTPIAASPIKQRRVPSPLVADLEARLREGVQNPKPNRPVNLGTNLLSNSRPDRENVRRSLG